MEQYLLLPLFVSAFILAASAAIPSSEQLLYASFSDAVYAYDGTQWLPVPVAHAPAFALGVHDGQLYGSFTDATYFYDGHTWTVFSYPTQALAAY